jgi:hypothetical protein
MGPKMTVEETLARLEAQIEHHRTQEAVHAAEEERHRAERARHAAALEDVTRRCTAFRAAADAVADLAGRLAPPCPPDPEALPPRERTPTRLIARLLPELGPEESFGASRLTRDIDRRFGALLARPIQRRLVSIVLGRMARQGRIHRLRSGRPHWEALYARQRPPESATEPRQEVSAS